MLVRSQGFTFHQIIGNPVNEVARFNEWSVDELIYIDISSGETYDQRRSDHRVRDLSTPLKILQQVSASCFVPLTFGGRIRTLADIHERIAHGADKVALTTGAFHTPDLVSQASRVFGSQAVVVGIDVRRSGEGVAEAFVDGGREPTGLTPTEWAKRAEDLGAGEILLQSIDRDGDASGYDLELIETVASAVTIPLIALGGAGRFDHYAEALGAGASAVAAANLWHFKEHADRGGKRAIASAGFPVREIWRREKTRILGL